MRVAGLSDGQRAALVEAARDVSPVAGLTHNFYRYPARASPRFVRAAVETFTDTGDLVFDPFMGGGTTIVEASALGRRAVGVDISSLATFVASVKTTLYSDKQLELLESWGRRALRRINMAASEPRFRDYSDTPYQKHLDLNFTWRLRKAISQALDSARRLPDGEVESLARCALLRTAQWALDGRRTIPSIDQFRSFLNDSVNLIVSGATEYRDTFRRAAGPQERVRILHSPVTEVAAGYDSADFSRPRLVLTSPPYPGVHVLYHRWQVDGRKETAAPFWIANSLDGDGASYYTMGSRRGRGLDEYFENMRAALAAIATHCDNETLLIQVVAFFDPVNQLSRYLSIADDVGLVEHLLPVPDSPDGRLWRAVPNRKWHANQRGKTHGSFEVVLFHRRRS